MYYLQQQFPPEAEKFIDSLLKDGQPVISAIIEIELLCWKITTEKDQELLHSFIKDALVIELEQSIKFKAANIRKAHRIKLPNAIIASTALVYDLSLVSCNTADFKNLQGLKVINPYSL